MKTYKAYKDGATMWSIACMQFYLFVHYAHFLGEVSKMEEPSVGWFLFAAFLMYAGLYVQARASDIYYPEPGTR